MIGAVRVGSCGSGRGNVPRPTHDPRCATLTPARKDTMLKRHTFRDTCRDQSGVFDMATILVGATVLTFMFLTVLAVTYGVIPWSQDKSAQSDLKAIVTAQSVYFGKRHSVIEEGTQFARYATSTNELVDVELLPTGVWDGGRIITSANSIDGADDVAGFWAARESHSGNFFIVTFGNTDARRVNVATIAEAAAVAEADMLAEIEVRKEQQQ